MKFALDYDGTFTEDNALWAHFVDKAKERGHSVTFVTFRTPECGNQDIEADAQLLGIDIVYTSGGQKADHFKAHVWIDDMPDLIPSEASYRLASLRYKSNQEEDITR